MQGVDHGEEDRVQRLLLVLLEDQVVHVRDADLRREARIDGAAARAGAVHILAGELGVHQVLWLQAQALQIPAKQGRVQVHVQHAWHANAQAGALLHQRDALFSGRRPSAASGVGSATFCGLRERQTSRAAMSTKFGLAFLTASRPALIPRIAPTSSTCPFSQVEMIRRRSPA